MTYAFGANFAALLAEYESGPGGELVTQAYQDPKGVWTGPGGMTFHQDGRRVAAGDSWSPEEALALIAWGKRSFAAEIERALPKGLVLSQNQFDALGFLAWNNGTDVITQGSVAEALQAIPPRFEEAASRMTLYRRMTLWGGMTGPDGAPVRDPEGKVMEKGLSWFKAMRGIYRRSCATALLFLSLDWREATASDQVHMAKRPEWVPRENRWVDVVVDQTSWKEIHDRARRQTLPDRSALMATRAEPPAKPKDADRLVVRVQDREIVLPADWETMKPNDQTAWLNGYMDQRLATGTKIAEKYSEPIPPAPPPKPAAPAKTTKATPVPVDQVPYLDAAAKAAPKAKPIEDSQRGTGYARQKQAEAIGTVAVGGWMADQMGLVKPVLDFTAKYTPSQIAVGAALIGLPTIGLWYYGKWRRRKGEDEADTLLK